MMGIYRRNLLAAQMIKEAKPRNGAVVAFALTIATVAILCVGGEGVSILSGVGATGRIPYPYPRYGVSLIEKREERNYFSSPSNAFKPDEGETERTYTTHEIVNHEGIRFSCKIPSIQDERGAAIQKTTEDREEKDDEQVSTLAMAPIPSLLGPLKQQCLYMVP